MWASKITAPARTAPAIRRVVRDLASAAGGGGSLCDRLGGASAPLVVSTSIVDNRHQGASTIRQDASQHAWTDSSADAEGAPAKLENLTLWERVHRYLREEILSNRLPPGTVLGEAALAAELGVSRGPLREALGRLAAEGLVDVRPRRGAVVSALTTREFLEAYQVREALEALAMRLAVPRIGDEEAARLGQLVDQQARLVEGGDVDRFFQANAAFHDMIVAASGNDTLIEMYRQLLGHMGRYRMRSLALRGTLKRSVTEHRAILRAISSGDVEKAVHLMSEHIQVPQLRLESGSDEEVILTP